MTAYNGFDDKWLAEYQAKNGMKPRPLPQPAALAPKSPRGGRGKAVGHSAGVPNKTETRFEQEFLRPMELSAQIHDWKYEPMSFRLSGGKRRSYRPDYVAWRDDGCMTCFEIKGAYKFSRDSREKFMSARAEYPWIAWEAWQWKNGVWRLIWE